MLSLKDVELDLCRDWSFKNPVAPVIKKAMEKGLILINAGTNIIRFIPPLVITKEDVDDMMVILKASVSECYAE